MDNLTKPATLTDNLPEPIDTLPEAGDPAKYMKFDRDKLADLKRKWEDAVAAGVLYFNLDGQVFYTGYAKYLIQYLEQELKRGPDEG